MATRPSIQIPVSMERPSLMDTDAQMQKDTAASEKPETVLGASPDRISQHPRDTDSLERIRERVFRKETHRKVRNRRIQLYLTEDNYVAVKRNADAAGLSLNEYINRVLDAFKHL